jgi:hypothetical protein
MARLMRYASDVNGEKLHEEKDWWCEVAGCVPVSESQAPAASPDPNSKPAPEPTL